MAFRPMGRPDPQQETPPSDAPNASPPEVHGGGSLASPANSERLRPTADLSPDLVLELALNEVVEQTLLATNATGAAIALIRDDEMVCRATAGANAPDLGVRLNTDSGISGICVRLRETQHCEDTENDPRVDRLVCRQLGVRSILIVPVLGGDRLLGVFEIFSTIPGAFSDRDAATLEALSRKVIELTRRTEVQPTAEPSVEPSLEALSEPPREAQVASSSVPSRPLFSPTSALPSPAPSAPPAEAQPGQASIEPPSAVIPGLIKARRRDSWTQILTASVVVVALLLGWVLGRVEWFKATHSKIAHASPNAMQKAAPPPAARAESQEPGGVAAPGAQGQASEAENSDQASEVQAGGADRLAVSSNRSSENQPAASDSSRPELRAEILRSRRGLVTSELADSYLLKRVEPEYPEVARRQHVQGAVLLHVRVNPDGTLGEVTVVSGPPLLAAAAADAVWQWRFKPLLTKGSPAGFETRVKVDFRLP
jgi:TonB family protein